MSKIPPVDRNAHTLADGTPVTDDHREIKPESGQQKGYVVLSAEERAKGFIRPVRRTYTHVGRKVCGKIRQDDNLRLGGMRRICVCAPGHDGECTQWTEVDQPTGQRAKDEHHLGGCGCNTTMSLPIAETYARDPEFYSGTFCCHCRQHLPLNEFVWTGTNEQVGS